MKVLFISLSLLVALNALACDGSGKGKGKEKEKEEERITMLR
jgi:hypothetical protein